MVGSVLSMCGPLKMVGMEGGKSGGGEGAQEGSRRNEDSLQTEVIAIRTGFT